MIFESKSFVIQLTFIILGVLGLIRSDSYHAPYVIACLFALFCLYGNHLESSIISEKLTVKGMIYTLILSMFLGMMITMANHSIWLKPPMPDIRTAMFYRLYKLFLVTVLFAGSTTSIMNMLVFITFHKYDCPIKKRTGEPHQAILYFVIPFLLMVTVYTVIWLCCYYPAIMSVDAINQVSQILTGNYSNHHPVMHTLLIKAFFCSDICFDGGYQSGCCGIYSVSDTVSVCHVCFSDQDDV